MENLKEMAKKRGVPNKCFSRELSALAPFVQQDLITINDAVITVKEQGRIALRIIASVFDSYLEPEKKKHSVAV